MADQPPTRSVKIPEDERGGWSSDRPRRDGAPRQPNLSVRCRVLKPATEIRYSPGSILMIAAPSPVERDRLAERLDNRASLMSLDRVRGLIAGQVAEQDVEARAQEVLESAVLKRIEGNDTVVLGLEGFDPEERERYVRIAAGLRRPRHLILIDASREGIDEEHRAALNELRRRLDAGELGAEGFQTALRLGGGSLGELKRIVFRPPPKDD